MGVSHTSARRSAAPKADRVVRSRSRVAQREGVGDDRPRTSKKRPGRQLAVVSAEPSGSDRSPRVVDVEVVGDSARAPGRSEEVLEVIDAPVLGWWHDVKTLVGRAVADAISKELRRVLK